MLAKIIFYYFIVLITIIIFYIIGASVRFFFNNDSFRKRIPDIFLNLLLGLTITITVYSIFITGFKTINLFFVLLFIIFLNHTKEKANFKLTFDDYPELSRGKTFLYFFLVSIGYYLFFLLTIINIFEWSINGQTIDIDSSFYSKLSQYLSLGYENLFFARNFSENLGIQSYHYFEIWLTSMISTIFNLPSLVTYSSITSTILSVVFFTGVISLSNTQKKVTIVFLIFVFILTFLSFNYSRIIIKLIPSLSNYIFDLRFVGLTNKISYIPTSIFFISFLFFQQQKKPFYALLSLLCITIVSTTVAPAIFGGIALLVVYRFIRSRSIFLNKNNIIIVVIYITLYFFYLFITGLSEQRTDFFSFHLPGFFDAIIWYLIRFFISYLPFILIIFAQRNKVKIPINNNGSFFLYFTILISGLFMAGFALDNFNGKQFFNNAAIPITNIIIIYFFINYNYQNIGLFFKSAIVISVVLCFTSSLMGKIARDKDHSKKYKLEVLKEVESEKVKNGGENIYIGSLRSKEYYQDKTPFQTAATSLIDYHDLGQFLLLFENNIIIIGLSDITAYEIFKNCFDEPVRSEALKSVEKGTFYNYVLKQKANIQNNSVEKIQVDFIKNMNIKFLFVEDKTEIPSELQKYLKLVSSDSFSNEIFYKIQI